MRCVDRWRPGHRKRPLPTRPPRPGVTPLILSTGRQDSIEKSSAAELPNRVKLEQAEYIFAHLVFPIRPVMAALRAPIVERMANALAGKHFGEPVGGAAVFPGAGTGGKVDVAGGDLLVEPWIAHIREIIDWIVEIEIVIVHAVHKIAHVVHAGHSKTAFDHVGMLE